MQNIIYPYTGCSNNASTYFVEAKSKFCLFWKYRAYKNGWSLISFMLWISNFEIAHSSIIRSREISYYKNMQ